MFPLSPCCIVSPSVCQYCLSLFLKQSPLTCPLPSPLTSPVTHLFISVSLYLSLVPPAPFVSLLCVGVMSPWHSQCLFLCRQSLVCYVLDFDFFVAF